MKYNFDKIIERRDTECLKWDAPKFTMSSTYCESRDIIPMWVADMDFEVPDFIVEALQTRLEHRVYGYAFTAAAFFEKINKWQTERFHQSSVGRGEISYQNSVLGGVASALVAFSQPGDNILLNGATYTGFQSTVLNLGRNMAISHLVKDKNGMPRMNFEEMETLIKSKNIPVMIFCSPHNPSGRVWEKEEIEQVVALCKKYDVKLISDEIWADFIVDKSIKHIPTTSVNQDAKDITFALYAPSKTFNLAGLIGAYSICYNPNLNARINKVATATHYNGANILSVAACIAAYENGSDWVDEMNVYIRKNQEFLCEYLNSVPGVKVDLPQATYLLWADFRETGKSNDEIITLLKTKGIIVSNGKSFLQDGFLRFNCACPFEYIEKAVARMKDIF